MARTAGAEAWVCGQSRVLLGALLAAGLTLLALAAGAPATVTLTSPGTIRITDMMVRHTRVPAVRSVTGAGDLDFYRQLLFNTRITRSAIGHSDLTCVDTGTGSSNCSGTYFLPRGKIMVEGVIATTLFFQVAVVGGTGIYSNVRGTLTVTSLAQTPAARDLLIFRLGV